MWSGRQNQESGHFILIISPNVSTSGEKQPNLTIQAQSPAPYCLCFSANTVTLSNAASPPLLFSLSCSPFCIPSPDHTTANQAITLQIRSPSSLLPFQPHNQLTANSCPFYSDAPSKSAPSLQNCYHQINSGLHRDLSIRPILSLSYQPFIVHAVCHGNMNIIVLSRKKSNQVTSSLKTPTKALLYTRSFAVWPPPSSAA